jgi:hypothetical protein
MVGWCWMRLPGVRSAELGQAHAGVHLEDVAIGFVRQR